MKIEKRYLCIGEKKIDTYLTVYFQGNKEEVSIENNSMYIWCKDENTNEYWLELKVSDKDIFKNYLKNQEYLLNVIQKSTIKLYKRYYKNYRNFEYIQDIKYENLKNMDFILPNEKAILGYDFYSIFQKEVQGLYQSKYTPIDKKEIEMLNKEKMDISINSLPKNSYCSYLDISNYNRTEKFTQYERVA